MPVSTNFYHDTNEEKQEERRRQAEGIIFSLIDETEVLDFLAGDTSTLYVDGSEEKYKESVQKIVDQMNQTPGLLDSFIDRLGHGLLHDPRPDEDGIKQRAEEIIKDTNLPDVGKFMSKEELSRDLAKTEALDNLKRSENLLNMVEENLSENGKRETYEKTINNSQDSLKALMEAAPKPEFLSRVDKTIDPIETALASVKELAASWSERLNALGHGNRSDSFKEMKDAVDKVSKLDNNSSLDDIKTAIEAMQEKAQNYHAAHSGLRWTSDGRKRRDLANEINNASGVLNDLKGIIDDSKLDMTKSPEKNRQTLTEKYLGYIAQMNADSKQAFKDEGARVKEARRKAEEEAQRKVEEEAKRKAEEAKAAREREKEKLQEQVEMSGSAARSRDLQEAEKDLDQRRNRSIENTKEELSKARKNFVSAYGEKNSVSEIENAEQYQKDAKTIISLERRLNRLNGQQAPDYPDFGDLLKESSPGMISGMAGSSEKEFGAQMYEKNRQLRNINNRLEESVRKTNSLKSDIENQYENEDERTTYQDLSDEHKEALTNTVKNLLALNKEKRELLGLSAEEPTNELVASVIERTRPSLICDMAIEENGKNLGQKLIEYDRELAERKQAVKEATEKLEPYKNIMSLDGMNPEEKKNYLDAVENVIEAQGKEQEFAGFFGYEPHLDYVEEMKIQISPKKMTELAKDASDTLDNHLSTLYDALQEKNDELSQAKEKFIKAYGNKQDYQSIENGSQYKEDAMKLMALENELKVMKGYPASEMGDMTALLENASPKKICALAGDQEKEFGESMKDFDQAFKKAENELQGSMNAMQGKSEPEASVNQVFDKLGAKREILGFEKNTMSPKMVKDVTKNVLFDTILKTAEGKSAEEFEQGFEKLYAGVKERENRMLELRTRLADYSGYRDFVDIPDQPEVIKYSAMSDDENNPATVSKEEYKKLVHDIIELQSENEKIRTGTTQPINEERTDKIINLTTPEKIINMANGGEDLLKETREELKYSDYHTFFEKNENTRIPLNTMDPDFRNKFHDDFTMSVRSTIYDKSAILKDEKNYQNAELMEKTTKELIDCLALYVSYKRGTGEIRRFDDDAAKKKYGDENVPERNSKITNQTLEEFMLKKPTYETSIIERDKQKILMYTVNNGLKTEVLNSVTFQKMINETVSKKGLKGLTELADIALSNDRTRFYEHTKEFSDPNDIYEPYEENKLFDYATKGKMNLKIENGEYPPIKVEVDTENAYAKFRTDDLRNSRIVGGNDIKLRTMWCKHMKEKAEKDLKKNIEKLDKFKDYTGNDMKDIRKRTKYKNTLLRIVDAYHRAQMFEKNMEILKNNKEHVNFTLPDIKNREFSKGLANFFLSKKPSAVVDIAKDTGNFLNRKKPGECLVKAIEESVKEANKDILDGVTDNGFGNLSPENKTKQLEKLRENAKTNLKTIGNELAAMSRDQRTDKNPSFRALKEEVMDDIAIIHAIDTRNAEDRFNQPNASLSDIKNNITEQYRKAVSTNEFFEKHSLKDVIKGGLSMNPVSLDSMKKSPNASVDMSKMNETTINKSSFVGMK